MWHASVACQRLHLPDEELRRIALDVLKGLGDANLGQWDGRGASAFHLRRRLSEAEAELVGPVVDIRGTDEAGQRLLAVRDYLRQAGMTDWAYEEERTGMETASVSVPRWDHKLYERSVLSDYDQRCLPYAISQYLHNVTSIPHCNGGANICAMCGGAVRLVLQAAEPKIKRAILEKMQHDLGVRCPFPHPGDD